MTVIAKLRRSLVALAVVAAGAPMLAAAPAAAESGADLVEACQPATDIPEAGHRACGSLERFIWLAAGHCRRVPGADEVACPNVDGRPVNEAAMVDFEQSWAARALDLQRDLDQDVPLTDGLFLHTHNSANSTAYAPSVTSNDANQVLTVTDQLRLGIRAIEIDVHWTEHPTGDPDHGFREPVQCHGQTHATPVGSVHPGCSVDQPLADLLVEFRAWLDRPEHADELVILYLENQLEGSDDAHADAVAAIHATIGDLVYRPTAGGGCQDLPIDLSETDLLASGARVLITGNCGPGGWTDWVFQRGARWDESGGTTNYLSGSTCDAERAERSYDTKLIRRYEDSTFLSLMVNGGSYISPAVAADLVRCGVNLPGLDQLHPGDERLLAFIWSWREAEPSAGGDCAAQGADARFFADDCETIRPVACRTAGGAWAVSSTSVEWADGDTACQADGHAGAGVPVNGWDNELLRRAAGDADVWLAYGADDDGAWTVGIQADDEKPKKPKKPKKDKDDKPVRRAHVERF